MTSIFDKAKARPIGAPVCLPSEILGEDLYFKPLTNSRVQTYNIMSASLAQKIITNDIKEDTFTRNVYFLVRWSWVNKDGSYVLDSEAKYNEFCGDDFASEVVEEVIRLAVKAHQGIKTEKKTTSKKETSGDTQTKPAS